MAKEIKTSIVINSTSERVWTVLMNFNNYSNWNPFITSLQGEAKVGSKLTARMEAQKGKGMTFKPKVLIVEQHRKFSWIGHLLFPGLFDGEHTFELIDNSNGTITFVQREQFKGILVPLFKKMLDVDTVNGFNAMNAELKRLAEA